MAENENKAIVPLQQDVVVGDVKKCWCGLIYEGPNAAAVLRRHQQTVVCVCVCVCVLCVCVCECKNVCVLYFLGRECDRAIHTFFLSLFPYPQRERVRVQDYFFSQC